MLAGVSQSSHLHLMAFNLYLDYVAAMATAVFSTLYSMMST